MPGVGDGSLSPKDDYLIAVRCCFFLHNFKFKQYI